ncbi:LuxR C-terminal-related transcriptional regulator [Gaoshiqia sp. Z1-71]|uniref:LuxR C-terminal-related transcriptional regulator n=1 Tax=Gaoshiqia hydrogeniformans TaxID=3290090 RepID=UPI003BF8CFE8
MKVMYKVAILDQSNLFRSGLISILKEVGEFELLDFAGYINEFMLLPEEPVADVFILNILHDQDAGIESLGRIREKFPQIPVILIASPEYADYFIDYLNLGVKGFVFEDDSPAELVSLTRIVCDGRSYFRSDTERMIKDSVRENKPPHSSRKNGQILTKREISILKLFCGGLTYKEIGDELFISPRTVETHKKNILSKLKVNSTAGMVKYAFHHRLLF